MITYLFAVPAGLLYATNIHERMSAEANENAVFRFDSAELHPISYKYSEKILFIPLPVAAFMQKK